MDETKLFRLQTDVDGLKKTLDERDQFIRSLSVEISGLQNENQALKATLADVSETPPAAPPPIAVPSFSESRQEIERMEAALRSDLNAAQINSVVIADLEETRIKRDVAVKELAEQSAALAVAKSQAVVAQLENADLKDRLLKETQAASTAARDLDVIRQRVELSFTASQLAGYMSQAIDSFSREANAGDLSVAYVINEMEVTFKAGLTKNDTGEMTLAAPSLASGDEALSTIKFNIMAVPKTEEGDK